MDIWQTIKEGLKVVAPIAANAIVPNSGGMVSALISKALGVEDNPVAIAATLQNLTGEQRVALREMELKHEDILVQAGLDTQKLELEAERTRLADVADARRRQIDHEKTTGKTDTNLYALAWLVVAGFFILVAVLMFVTLPTGNVGPINQLFGTLGTGFGLVLGYFFGSSMSSSYKTQLLAQAQPIIPAQSSPPLLAQTQPITPPWLDALAATSISYPQPLTARVDR